MPSITDLEIVVGEPVDLSYSIIKRNEIVTTLDNDDPNLAIEIDEPTNAEIVDGKLNGLMKGNIKLNATYTYLGNDLVSSISLRVREKYTVSYYAHGELVHEEVVLDGDNITYVPESNKEGHVFKCWIKNGQPFSSPIESNIKVSAMWEVDKYDYNQGLYGALTYVRSNESNNSEPEIATDEPDFGNGLKYSLPQVADSDYNVIVLPKVDYSEVTKTTFTFKMSGWTFVGPTNEQRWYDAGSTLSGTINVLSLASGVQVIMQEKTHGSFMITIDDNDVLHGNKSLTLSATCLGGTQYFYLSKPNMNYSDEMFYDFTTSNYGGYIELTNDTSVQKSFQVTENVSSALLTGLLRKSTQPSCMALLALPKSL